MDILREKIALAVCEALPVGLHASSAHHTSQRAADAILAIPELKEALENRRYPAAYARIVDGTDSLHPCAKGDPDAIPLYR